MLEKAVSNWIWQSVFPFMWPHTPTHIHKVNSPAFFLQHRSLCLVSRVWSHNWCPQTSPPLRMEDLCALYWNTNIEMRIRTVFWPLLLIRPYSRTALRCTALRGDWHQYVYRSVTEQPQAASSVHPITKAVTPCLISLMGDPWQAAPALTSRGPQINVLTAGCGREGRREHPSCLSVHNTRGLIIEAVIANGRATCANGA